MTVVDEVALFLFPSGTGRRMPAFRIGVACADKAEQGLAAIVEDTCGAAPKYWDTDLDYRWLCAKRRGLLLSATPFSSLSCFR